MNTFILNLSRILAHSIIFFTKEEYSPNSIVDDVVNSSDPAAQTTPQSMASILQAYQAYMPGLVKTTDQSLTPMAQAGLGAAQATAPAYNTLMQGLNQSNELANASAANAVLQGPGADLAKTQQSLNQEINPQYYTARNQASGGYTSLLNNLNPNNPNPAAERDVLASNAATGNTGNNNATNTTSNAMQFGNADLTRTQAFGNALSGLTGFMNGSTDQSVNPMGAPMNQSQNVSSSGASNAGSAGLGFGTNMLNDSTALQTAGMDINANRRDTVDRINGTISSLPNY